LGGLDFRENRLATQSDTRDVHDLDASFASIYLLLPCNIYTRNKIMNKLINQTHNIQHLYTLSILVM
jgi:hypothetical protein